MTTPTTHSACHTKHGQAEASPPKGGGVPAVRVVARLACASEGHAADAGASARVGDDVGGDAGVLGELDAALGARRGMGVPSSSGGVLAGRPRHVYEEAHLRLVVDSCIFFPLCGTKTREMACVVLLFATGFTLGPPPVGDYGCVRSSPFHKNIHNFGNVGLGGKVHALFARLATTMIDVGAYKGRTMRREVAAEAARVVPSSSKVLEVGCGVGTLTNELERVFSNVTAVDTSQEMLDAAECTRTHARLVCLNGVDAPAVLGRDHDLVIVSMVMHEMPSVAYPEFVGALLEAAPQGNVWIVDIHENYTPSPMMQSGEPYVLDYLSNIDQSLQKIARDAQRPLETRSIIEGHVRLWMISH